MQSCFLAESVVVSPGWLLPVVDRFQSSRPHAFKLMIVQEKLHESDLPAKQLQAAIHLKLDSFRRISKASAELRSFFRIARLTKQNGNLRAAFSVLRLYRSDFRGHVRTLVLLSSLLLCSVDCALGDAPSIDEAGVADILSRRCLSCHNESHRKGDLSLRTNTDVESLGLIIAGDPDSSYLLDVLIKHGDAAPKMPKDADPLKPSEIAVIREWITDGASWPSDYSLRDAVVEDFDWWSLQPLQRPPLPKITDPRWPAWSNNPIDRFLLKEMQSHGLSPSAPASRRQLIRRVTYDLTGLPPTPAEVNAFLNDDQPGSYERLINRLLASPAYGEHWARHWLDVVKYADTCGYDKDKLREHAWPYRDYVIESFNSDKPYSRFVQEQLAGDVLFPGTADGILGLGFIAAGPWDFIGHVEVSEAKLDGKIARNLDRDDMVSNALNTFCSVTIQCARCHNHKFDPFTQEHYYSLQAVFAAVDRADRTYNLDPQIEQQKRDLNNELAQTETALKELEQQIANEGGERLQSLTSRLKELNESIQPKSKAPEYGYHSQIAKSPDTVKWVQIDLEQPGMIHELILHACHDDYANIGSGFGFPVRFRIEGALDKKEFDTPGLAKVLVDETQQDVNNPGLLPLRYSVPAQPVRYLRISATKLAERKNDFIFALAEFQALNADAENLAHAKVVESLDSIEAPVRWKKQNLTDGIWAKPSNLEEAHEYQSVQLEHDELWAKVNTPDRQKSRQQFKDTANKIREQLKALPEGKLVYAAATEFASRGNFKPTHGTPRSVSLLHRGDMNQPGKTMSPGVLPLHKNERWQLSLPADHTEGDRRAALANWITDHTHPLTWRSIVNRIWLWHFGEGIAASPNDFGRMGQTPTHPELLDWLAMEFLESGESFKHLHRLIVTSQAYQQTSAQNPDYAAIDASNRYLWRMNRRRLSAEEIRDSILAVSGELDPTMGGPGDRLFVLERPEHSPHYQYHLFDPAKAERHRRSVYRFVVRSQPDPWMSVLDCADSSQSTPKRSETLTALQALSLLNNDFNTVMAERFAHRIQQGETTTAEQVELAFELTANRPLEALEKERLVTYAREHGLSNMCRLLLNMNEFIFID